MNVLFNTIDRYIARHVVKGWLLIMLIVLALFSFLELVNQLDDVGDGEYTLMNAFTYVLLTIPKRIVMLTPVAAMVGSVIALVGLANDGELMAMRAAGMSMQRIVISLLKTGMVIMLVAYIFEQWVAPSLEQKAIRMRSVATSGFLLASDDGFWSRNHQHFIRVGDIEYGRLPSDIEIIEFNNENRLTSYVKADLARLLDNGKWLLSNASIKQFSDRDITLNHYNELEWKTFLSDTEIRALEFPIASLSITDLSGYVDYLRSTNEPYLDHHHQLWRKISRPILAAVMVLLASLFAFGSHRAFNKGKRIVQASIIALILYFVTEIIANTGVILGLDAIATAILPIGIILLIVLVQTRRTF